MIGLLNWQVLSYSFTNPIPFKNWCGKNPLSYQVLLQWASFCRSQSKSCLQNFIGQVLSYSVIHYRVAFQIWTNPISSRDLSLQPASMMDAYILVATIVFGLLSRPLQADVPRCDKENPDFTKSPYCLPVTYNKDLIPPTEGPLHINVDIFVFEVLPFTFFYSSNKIRKTQNEHLNIVSQNLIGL